MSVCNHSETFKLVDLFSSLESLSAVRLIICSTSLFKVIMLKIHEKVFTSFQILHTQQGCQWRGLEDDQWDYTVNRLGNGRYYHHFEGILERRSTKMDQIVFLSTLFFSCL